MTLQEAAVQLQKAVEAYKAALAREKQAEQETTCMYNAMNAAKIEYDKAQRDFIGALHPGWLPAVSLRS